MSYLTTSSDAQIAHKKKLTVTFEILRMQPTTLDGVEYKGGIETARHIR